LAFGLGSIMKIAVISPYALDRPGGVQQQTAELVVQLRRRGSEAWLIGPGEGGPPGSRLLGKTVPIPANRSVAPISLAPRVRERLRLAVGDADVVHLHEPLIPLVGTAGLATGLPPVLGTFHARQPEWIRRILRAGGQVTRNLLQRLSAATAVSPIAAEAVRSLVEELEIVPNGVDVARYGPRERVDRRVAFLGRDEPRKGLDVLLEAWRAVRRSVPSAELVVIGADRDVRSPGVEFVGVVDDDRKREELGRSAVLCAPNLGGESFGITVLEGLASGCAVVVSDVPAFAHVVGDAGLLVPPGDPESLAEALVRVLRSPGLAEELGGRATERAARFDWGRVLPRYETLYERIVKA
jgi:phosphatidylinositol alpha-mannosyltransferase